MIAVCSFPPSISHTPHQHLPSFLHITPPSLTYPPLFSSFTPSHQTQHLPSLPHITPPSLTYLPLSHFPPSLPHIRHSTSLHSLTSPFPHSLTFLYFPPSLPHIRHSTSFHSLTSSLPISIRHNAPQWKSSLTYSFLSHHEWFVWSISESQPTRDSTPPIPWVTMPPSLCIP